MGPEFLDTNIQNELFGLDGKVKVKHPSKGSRAEMERHFMEIPADIRSQLGSGKLRLADTIIYSVKPVGTSKTIKLFETQDVKEVALSNISNGKLPKNSTLLVSGIYLLQGKVTAAVPGSPTEDEIKACVFGSIKNIGAIANGEFSFKANKVTIVPENTPTRLYVTDNNTNWPLGYYKLNNPRLIADDLQIEFTVELGSTVGIPQDTFLYVGLYGTITTP